MTILSRCERHRDLALRLLVARALGVAGGWIGGGDTLLSWLTEERLLWAEMSPEEQAEEQVFLAGLWRTPPSDRWVEVNPEWGIVDQGPRILIPNSAFGLPEHAHRPADGGAGVVVGKPEEWGVQRVVEWLQSKGFLVTEVGDQGILLRLPAHRVSQESDRLLVLLCRKWEHLRARLVPSDEAPVSGVIQFRASYDPVGGMATLKIRGLTDASLHA